MTDPLVRGAIVAAGPPHAHDRPPATRLDGVDDGRVLQPAEAEPAACPHHAGPRPHHVGVRRRRQQPRHHVDRLVVAAKGLAARHRRRQGEGGHEVRQRQRQRGRIGHHEDEPPLWHARGERVRHARHLAVQVAHHDGRAAEVVSHRRRHRHLDLLGRVAELHLAARAHPRPRLAGQVPVHDMPAGRPEADVDGGGVHHHAIADRHRPDQLRERVGTAPVVQLDALEPGPFRQQYGDASGDEGRHRRSVGPTRSATAWLPAVGPGRPGATLGSGRPRRCRPRRS